ncbi:hypothetical protein [Dethiobacter alkaliphilus]|uniref:hypothetical protein n=1 Tax=Dethiobacter alkaliphilus TaxID=427926 RepID=UPI002227C247|nr:hypothetical protein [Dethiobacter alkaliphilus]MCW3490750.1 hypothetical protein [Dethiobacter alkaliphilus]
MVKAKQQSKQDAYTTNLLISLLMRFPEIMSINFNMPDDHAKFTFILVGSVKKEDFAGFTALLDESLSAFQELTGESFALEPKLQRTGKLSLLEVSCCTTSLSLEAIQLLCGVVSGTFAQSLLQDGNTLETIHDEEMVRQEEIIDYLLTHSTGAKKDNLLAFRESGKVFVYDK